MGDFIATGVDEGVSEGTVRIRGYFDYVNPRDQVVFAPKPAPKPSVQPAERSGNMLTRPMNIHEITKRARVSTALYAMWSVAIGE